MKIPGPYPLHIGAAGNRFAWRPSLTLIHMLNLSVREGNFILHPDEIICLQASRNYTRLFFSNGSKGILSAKTLKWFEEELPAAEFVRVHSSFLINTRHIKQMEKNGPIHLTDNKTIPVSKRKRTEVWRRLNTQS